METLELKLPSLLAARVMRIINDPQLLSHLQYQVGKSQCASQSYSPCIHWPPFWTRLKLLPISFCGLEDKIQETPRGGFP